jgi:hypothetical protein
VVEHNQIVVKVLVDEVGEDRSGAQRLLLSPTPSASAGTLNPLPSSSTSAGSLQVQLQQRQLELLQQSSPALPPEEELQQPEQHHPQHHPSDAKMAAAATAGRRMQQFSLGATNTTAYNQLTSSASSDPFSDKHEKIRWQRAELIGSGAFGRVYLGLNLDTGQLMAVKHLELTDVSDKALSALENEVRTLKGLMHENIVQYLGCSFSDANSPSGDDNGHGVGDFKEGDTA